MHYFQDDDGTPKSVKSVKSVRHGPKTKSFSKERPAGILKDRPATILGSALKSQRVSRDELENFKQSFFPIFSAFELRPS